MEKQRGWTFLNTWDWEPNGFISAEDNAEQQRWYAGSIRIPGMFYEAIDPRSALDPYRGDESFGGNSFQYIPTELDLGAAIAMRNMSTAGELPVQQNAPGMNQLLQSLYSRTASFWSDIRAASGSGW